jgi:hypothetical protein
MINLKRNQKDNVHIDKYGLNRDKYKSPVHCFQVAYTNPGLSKPLLDDRI